MQRFLLVVSLSVVSSCGSSQSEVPDAPIDGQPLSDEFSFFITSREVGAGGDFRRSPADTDGLAGADEHCRALAVAAVPAAGAWPWRAYLSTDTVNARDRIGAGPWTNRLGVVIAASVAALHDPPQNLINRTNGVDENGVRIPGPGESVVLHDILTGSDVNGMSVGRHCNNWTTSADTGAMGQVGHHDRAGGGDMPTSWNSAHPTNGCSTLAFRPSGGSGLLYCFVAH